jgi:hypothetical protein
MRWREDLSWERFEPNCPPQNHPFLRSQQIHKTAEPCPIPYFSGEVQQHGVCPLSAADYSKDTKALVFAKHVISSNATVSEHCYLFSVPAVVGGVTWHAE